MSKYIVIFEVIVTEEGKARYLEIAKILKPMLNGFDGFISAERFQSLIDDRKLLSMNVWESEDALIKWRNMTEHRLSQLEGKTVLFESYKISVSQVIREYTDENRTQAPADSNEYFK